MELEIRRSRLTLNVQPGNGSKNFLEIDRERGRERDENNPRIAVRFERAVEPVFAKAESERGRRSGPLDMNVL